jgi:hypothetical protein
MLNHIRVKINYFVILTITTNAKRYCAILQCFLTTPCYKDAFFSIHIYINQYFSRPSVKTCQLFVYDEHILIETKVSRRGSRLVNSYT